ncbi:hypothetical protein [Paramuribaculum intestinale]|nr:hypothetical protein [Paramuribaculum intestinale]
MLNPLLAAIGTSSRASAVWRRYQRRSRLRRSKNPAWTPASIEVVC